MIKSYLKASMAIGLATASAGNTLAQDNGPADPQVIAAADTTAPTATTPGGFHRHSEGSAVQLDSGRILLSWSRFYTTAARPDRDDNSPGTIVSAYSDDLGATWSTPQPMPVGTTVTTGWNVMQSAFLKLEDRLQLYYSVREQFTSAAPTGKFLIESTDGGQTWSDRRMITPGNVVITGPNDRAMQLSTGRIILPVHRGTDGPRVAWSDDDGATWGITSTLAYNDPLAGQQVEEPKVHEPAVIERSDGSLYMLARTTRGQLAHGTSTDGGQTWTTLQPSGIPSLTAPPYMRTLDDGRVLLLWNRPTDAQIAQYDGKVTPGTLKRQTLMGAISTDDAHNWSTPFVVMNDGGTSAFHYPALLELSDGDQMLLFASRSPGNINVSDLVMRRLSKWEMPAQQAGQAELFYDPGTGKLWLDVGSGVNAVEIGGSDLDGATLAAFNGVSPSYNGGLALYDAAAGDLAFAKGLLGTLDTGLDGAGLTFRWQPAGGQWIDSPVTVVPEPGAAGGALLLTLALARRRREAFAS